MWKMSGERLLKNRLSASVPPAVKPALRQALILHRLPWSRLRTLPDFIIIGAQRSGTTSLYRYLISHPEIRSASRKEVHFFDVNFWRGQNWYRAHFPFDVSSSMLGKGERSWITGEASPYYIFHPLAAERTANVLPEVKLIALLRNPIDCTCSHYYHNVRRGYEHLSFREAIEIEAERLRGEKDEILKDGNYQSDTFAVFSYLTRGHYAHQLREWLRYYSRSQILILKSEDFFADPRAGLEQVFNFLNLPCWYPNDYKQHFAFKYPGIDPALRKRLVTYFEPYNQDLYDLLGLNFAWK